MERILLALLLVTAAQANDSPDPAAIERGRKAFIAACGFCHGNDATGNRAPDLIRSPLVNRDEAGNLIGPVIKNGRPDKEMPAFPALTAQQISDMVAFLHARIRESIDSNRVPNDYPLGKLLTGDPAQGRVDVSRAGGAAAANSPAAE